MIPKRLAVAFALACLLAAGAVPQKRQKPWTEWSKIDADKILNDSPWGQTQIETDTSEMFYTPTTRAQASPSASNRTSSITGQTPPGSGDSLSAGRATEGALNQSTSVKFRIRWFSSRPIRRAMAREVALSNGGRLTDQLVQFADGPSEKRAVIAVTFEANDQRFGGKVMQAFNAATAATLKNSTYLELKDGKRVFLQDYIPPTGNRLGAAMFVFPRSLGERPLLSPDSGDVRFFSEFSRALKLDMKFKVSDMIYEGRLEY
jgi:hypothetical protein